MKLRPAQQEILKYRQGRLAVSAVPGSGKTLTLALLAAELIANRKVLPEEGQQILIVTYLNSAVENFRAAIRRILHSRQLEPTGYDVRTLHSLAFEIIRTSNEGSAIADQTIVDDVLAGRLLASAIETWQEANSEKWHSLEPLKDSRTSARWARIVRSSSREFIRVAKNQRLDSEEILKRLDVERASNSNTQDLSESAAHSVLANPGILEMLAGIYSRYQSALARHGMMDFDDLVWQAIRLVEEVPDLRQNMILRWPYVLEDEAQDSSPLQQQLLEHLYHGSGNWVRVGDPNQAITSTFTAAHMKHFLNYLKRTDVKTITLPNSGRSAPKIIAAANHLVDWVCESHPLNEIREGAMRQQHIVETKANDAQPNPPDVKSEIIIKVYKYRARHEIVEVARLAAERVSRNPADTVAILVPTNEMGNAMAKQLGLLGAPFDQYLRGASWMMDAAEAVGELLTLLADPLNSRNYPHVYLALRQLDHPAVRATEEIEQELLPYLRSIYRPESFLYPENAEAFGQSFPQIAVDDHIRMAMRQFADFLSPLFALRALTAEDAVTALTRQLFYEGEEDRIGQAGENAEIAHGLAATVLNWRTVEPDLRLPEIAARLRELSYSGGSFLASAEQNIGLEPKSGRITLMTQHRAKGLEWDAVYLMGIDGTWIPNDLNSAFIGVDELSGVDPRAEVREMLAKLMAPPDNPVTARSATEVAQIEVIAERLRLFYVGITRAKRFLHISRSQLVERTNQDVSREPSLALKAVYNFVAGYKDKH